MNPRTLDLLRIHPERSEGSRKWCVLMPEDDVFTVQEVATYLRMRPVTIYKHAKAGKLPCFKVGANWRFKKSTIDRWISEQEAKENNGHPK